MARRKQEEDSGGGGNAPWMNTFADLMNLLLCFFVLLFSMSTVDATKYQAFITSFSDSISIFETRGDQIIGDANFPNSGTDQLVSISDFFKEFDQESTSDGEQSQTNPNTENTEDTSREDMSLGQMQDELKKAQKAQLEDLEQKVEGQAQEQGISNILEINTDANDRYVQISLKGAILFDVGEDRIKTEARPVLRKIARMLLPYRQNGIIQIEGHTDNVPISGVRFRDNMELSQSRAYSVYEFFKSNTDFGKRNNIRNLKSAGRGEYEPVETNNTAAGRARNRRIEFKIEPTFDFSNTMN